jgi:tetratricopeptide (TPR) repeat protein
MFNLGAAYLKAERYGEAADFFQKLLETHTRLNGPDHPDSLEASGALQEAYRLAGNRNEGKRLALRRIDAARKQPDEIQLSSALATAADALLSFEDFASAEPLARECLQIRQTKLPRTWLCFNAQSILGGVLLGLAKYDEAEPLLLQAIEGLDEHLDEIPEQGRRHLEATIERLAKLYESTNRPEDAGRWNARLQETSGTQRSTE